jgi:coenzyme F420-reducing hydrogenase delta subunit
MASGSDDITAAAGPKVTAFVCANCARGAVAASCVPRPQEAPKFDWPFKIEQVMVPCTGTIQPEHLLKAIEAGADLVCVIGCAPDNCHRFEGSRRASRRVEHVGQLLEDLGLEAGRVMWLSLPGSASEDMAAAVGIGRADSCDGLDEKVRMARDQVVERLASLSPNPLRQDSALAGKPIQCCQEVD